MEISNSPSGSQSTSTNLMTLPSELHIQISTYLSYPDALALKHSSRHFYSMVFTGVRLKVDWLIERFEHKLECPMEKCSFSTDESFCNGQVCGIMERRRWHLECRRVRGGCLLVNGQTCRTDFVPGWFKMRTQGKRTVVKVMESWGHEGLFPLSFYHLPV
ncbi:hypothetical protein PEX1_007400 [Penicillium expansum]|uniref:F-box domain-containing protein n=1 Tax=Penicillium expansum TaxID=27334 RepID=A0A0A2KBU5_PENEN|nr:hypothetical protein PEX2_012430 [Penicillium expansum]KGO38967.1 hypothetical protein PEXP_058460 [Penicillium expansum]KGO61830.1 hypothetical protein PEX1_007400 [Penicillium expansum]KGO62207.1 hypothetical protein PEX2_012430 [Penicillium expansum]